MPHAQLDKLLPIVLNAFCPLDAVTLVTPSVMVIFPHVELFRAPMAQQLGLPVNAVTVPPEIVISPQEY